jgi:hypothetical protein
MLNHIIDDPNRFIGISGVTHNLYGQLIVAREKRGFRISGYETGSIERIH